MLILSRKKDEEIVIRKGDEVIVIKVLDNWCRLGITAPLSFNIVRSEIIDKENKHGDVPREDQS